MNNLRAGLRFILSNLFLGAMLTSAPAQGVANFRLGAASAAFSISQPPPTGPIILTNTPPPSSNSDCVTTPAGLVSWWKADGNANDSAGGNNGILQTNVSFANGEVGQAFLLNQPETAIVVPASSSLNVGLADGFTVEGWIKPANVNGLHPIIEWNDVNTEAIGIQLWIGQTPSSQGVLCAFFMDTNGNNYIQVPSLARTLVPNAWQHVAMTYSRISGVISVYVNGNIAARQTWGSFTPRTGSDLWIGHRPETCGGGCWTDGTYLNGLLDELSLYNRALSSEEIAAIYNAGSAGKCASTTTSTNDCVTPPAGLAGWWKGEGNASDSAGINNGTLMGDASYAAAEVGQGFELVNYGDYIDIPASTGLDVGANGEFTLESWINSSTLSQQQPIFDWKKDSVEHGAHFYISVPPNSGNLYANIVDTDNVSHIAVTTNGIVQIDVFQHVAVTYSKITGICDIYDNGRLVLSTNLGSFTPKTTTGLCLGERTEGGEHFVGVIDEASIYNRALSASDIAGIYDGGSAGKCSTTITTTNKPAVPSACIAAWWRAENNAFDSVGGNNGTLQGGVGYAAGEVGQAFLFNNPNANILVPASASLDVGSGDGFTLETWINPSDVAQNHPLFEWNNSVGWGVHFHIAPGQPFNASPGPGELYANIVDNYGGWHQLSSPGGAVVTNAFQHVALTYDKSSGVATIYCNGQIVAQQNLGSFTPSTAYNLYLGRRPPTGNDPNEVYSFAGLLDEPAIYNCALSQAEIQAIYQAGSLGKSTLELPTNPPTIVSQPLSQTVLQGSSATFSATAAGLGPLTYQWKLNSANLAKATNATLTLTNLHPAQAGIYSVTVSNPYGKVTSSNALLTVTAQNVLIYNYSGNEKVTTAKQEFSYNYSGEMFFIPGGTNGVFIGWATISGKKQYWVSAFSDYLVATIPGTANHTYTVLGKAGNNVDNNGQPHIWSYLHKGQNATLAIANKKTFSFPGTFACSDSHVYPDAQTGVMILREATSTYTYSSANTQSANNGGQTLADLVNALTQTLVKQGYKAQ